MRHSIASALAAFPGFKTATKKAGSHEEVAPSLMRAANLVMIRVGLMLAAFLVALATCITYYYRLIVSWLFF